MSTKDNHLGFRQARHSMSLKMSRSFDDAFDSLDNINSTKRNEKEKISSNIDDLKREAQEVRNRKKVKKQQFEKKRVAKRDEYHDKFKIHK